MTSRDKDRAGKPESPDNAGINDNKKTADSRAGAGQTSSDACVDFSVVGIGASAGGVSALEDFFSAIPPDSDPDMAFVLVQHLSPDYKSFLKDIISRHTRMQVFQVKDGMKVQPNRVYIIPPGNELSIMNGALQLTEPVASRELRMSIDFFFRSLAQDLRERAIAVVLSGTGSDGTLGVRAVKGEGGMVMVQDPSTAEYDGMPRSCLETDQVDFVLPPREMPAKLIDYSNRVLEKPSGSIRDSKNKDQNALNKIFVLLRTSTGHDFSQYKPSTIHRRIERRLAVHQIDGLENYLRYMQKNPGEVEALFRDMLIGVTSFFRDSEAFNALEEQVIPRLFAGKEKGSIIRVWTPGCSTGEESYSLAMLLAEQQDKLKNRYNIKIFASDIDSRAINTARTGLYPASIAGDLTLERLKRFFVLTSEDNIYQVNKNIREMVIFSEHNVLKDPPFSRMDLISCRNLLIYLGERLQKKLIPLFHYALNPEGYLFLGTSESIGGFRDLFATVDRKHKIYRHNKNSAHHQQAILDRFQPPPGTSAVHARPPAKPHSGRPTLQELTEKTLLRHMAPSAALVNSQGDILYLHGRTSQYLELVPGKASVNNILRMAKEGMRLELATALHKAVNEHKIVLRPNLPVKTNGGEITVNLTIHPVSTGWSDQKEKASDQYGTVLYLVTMEKSLQLPALPPEEGRTAEEDFRKSCRCSEADERIAFLQKELQARDEYIQTTFEELETSNEELSSSNEEMQSVNEELHSTNEELETSKEELHSVNDELQSKVAELAQAYNDMNNLLAGTNIGTLLVDMKLRIMRYTPAVTRVIDLIDSDIGRPLNHFSCKLKDCGSLAGETREVLENLIPRELEVESVSGDWYMMHIRPYRTDKNFIEGAVITVVEITRRKRAEEKLIQAKLRLERQELFKDVVATIREPMLVLDSDLRVLLASGSFYGTFEVNREETEGLPFYELGNRQWDIPELRRVLEEILRDNTELNDFEMSHDFERIGHLSLRLNARRIISSSTESEMILLAFEDITRRKKSEKG